MRHTFIVETVKKWLKSVYIYGRYRKLNSVLSLFWTTVYIQLYMYKFDFKNWVVYRYVSNRAGSAPPLLATDRRRHCTPDK